MKLSKLILAVSIAWLLVMVVLAACTAPQPPATNNDSVSCTAGLEAGLTTGPDAPLDLKGNLEMIVQPDQTFTGVLTLQKDNSRIPFSGQGAGRGLDLVFNPGNGSLLYAHGALEHPIYDCQGTAGGPLTGPRFGDQGDWTTYPPFIRVISGTPR